MKDHLIVRVVAKMLVPFVLLFGIYVQMHGDFGPGGGFQAGVIFATGFIIYGLVFGIGRLIIATPLRVLAFAMSAGVLLYAGVGIVTMLMGGAFLDYNALDPADPAHGQHIGIILVELGIGITVGAVMISIFITFAERWQR